MGSGPAADPSHDEGRIGPMKRAVILSGLAVALFGAVALANPVGPRKHGWEVLDDRRV